MALDSGPNNAHIVRVPNPPESSPQSIEETPSDLAGALVLIDAQRQALERQQREIELLRRKVDELCRKLFGKKSEKVDPNQLQLALEVMEQEKPAEEPLEMDSGESLGKDRKKRKGTFNARQK